MSYTEIVVKMSRHVPCQHCITLYGMDLLALASTSLSMYTGLWVNFPVSFVHL